MITESDRLAHALDEASSRWPEIAHDRAALLRRIIDAGVDELAARRANYQNERRLAVEKLAGVGDGVWPDGWRDRARDEWPD
jgi:hypothetical protein